MKRAIVRAVSDYYKSCVSEHPLHSELHLDRARKQHESYVSLLRDLGLDIIELEGLDDYPDCCFVEDTAVIQNGKAMITRIGEPSRRGEENSIEVILKEYFPTAQIQAPGTLDGGDVAHFSSYLISGQTTRTNGEGIAQLKDWIGQPVKSIWDPDIVHLKSYLTPINDDLVVVTSNYANHEVLRDFQKIIVPDAEAYAANTLTIGDTTLIPKGYPRTHELLKSHGLEIEVLDMTEFEKCEGALSCLSLIF